MAGEAEERSVKYGFVSCSKGKVKTEIPVLAKDLYGSPLFKKASTYAKGNYDGWYILSAEHGLVHPDKNLLPYDLTLNNMTNEERKTWTEEVFSQIVQVIPVCSDIYIHAGENYTSYLVPMLEAYGYKVNLPMKGLGIGQQLQWYNVR